VRVAGCEIADARPVTGGDICSAVRGRLDDGTGVFAKTLVGAPPDFFAAEARGLALLREAAGGPPLPDVVAVGDDGLVLSYVEPGAPSPGAAEAFGRALAALHASGMVAYGAERAGFIGSLPLDNTKTADWSGFYAERRVLPFLRLAIDRGSVADADRRAVEQVVARLTDLAGPPEPPARIHGDLWSGNVHWAADGRAWLVDAASAHGGHRETDLAMLAWFGAPHLERVLAAYDEVAPLADGWQRRRPLHQLHPMLVHAALFGGGYAARAGAAARAALGAG
jgi:fructosamine-3-kinase